MSEIQSALQATITKAISEGSIEAGNVTIFNMVPCIQPTQRWLHFYEAVSLWICIAPILRPQQREQLEPFIVQMLSALCMLCPCIIFNRNSSAKMRAMVC